MNFYKNHNPIFNDQGIALVFVLWVLVILSVIAGGYSYAMRGELRAAGLVRGETESYYMAFAGIQTGLYMFKKNQIGNDSAQKKKGVGAAWGVNVEIPEQIFGNGHFSLEIGNESGKININYADKGLLTLLFESFEIPEDQVKEIVDSILDWRDQDTARRLNGAENAFYSTLPEPYKARDNLFRTPDELLYVKGMTKKLYLKIAPLVTAVTIDTKGKFRKRSRMVSRTKVNINAASRGVLSLFPELSEKSIERVFAYRQNVGDISNVGTLRSLMEDERDARTAGMLTKYIDYNYNSFYTFKASGWMEDEEVKQSIEVLIKKESETKMTYRIVQWIDRVI